jgi:hypothetical protein
MDEVIPHCEELAGLFAGARQVLEVCSCHQVCAMSHLTPPGVGGWGNQRALDVLGTFLWF